MREIHKMRGELLTLALCTFALAVGACGGSLAGRSDGTANADSGIGASVPTSDAGSPLDANAAGSSDAARPGTDASRSTDAAPAPADGGDAASPLDANVPTSEDAGLPSDAETDDATVDDASTDDATMDDAGSDAPNDASSPDDGSIDAAIDDSGIGPLDAALFAPCQTAQDVYAETSSSLGASAEYASPDYTWVTSMYENGFVTFLIEPVSGLGGVHVYFQFGPGPLPPGVYTQPGSSSMDTPLDAGVIAIWPGSGNVSSESYGGTIVLLDYEATGFDDAGMLTGVDALSVYFDVSAGILGDVQGCFQFSK